VKGKDIQKCLPQLYSNESAITSQQSDREFCQDFICLLNGITTCGAFLVAGFLQQIERLLTKRRPNSYYPSEKSSPVHAHGIPIYTTRVADIEVRNFPVSFSDYPARYISFYFQVIGRYSQIHRINPSQRRDEHSKGVQYSDKIPWGVYEAPRVYHVSNDTHDECATLDINPSRRERCKIHPCCY